MSRILFLQFICLGFFTSCYEPAEEASNLESAARGNTFLKASFKGFAVKKKGGRLLVLDSAFPTKIHALDYHTLSWSDISLPSKASEAKIQLEPFPLQNVLFSYQKDSYVYTCLMKEVKLGEEKTIDDQHCYRQDKDADYMRRFADACAKINIGRDNRFDFKPLGKDFACNIQNKANDKENIKLILASCFHQDNCLNENGAGGLLKLLESNNFEDVFKKIKQKVKWCTPNNSHVGGMHCKTNEGEDLVSFFAEDTSTTDSADAGEDG